MKHRNNQLGRDKGVILEVLKLSFWIDCGLIVSFYILIRIMDAYIL
jgi:hypothetical protein